MGFYNQTFCIIATKVATYFYINLYYSFSSIYVCIKYIFLLDNEKSHEKVARGLIIYIYIIIHVNI